MRAAHQCALQRAGWSQGRIRRALAEVRGRDTRLAVRLRFKPSGRDVAFLAGGASLCGVAAGGTGALGFIVGWIILHVFDLLP